MQRHSFLAVGIGAAAIVMGTIEAALRRSGVRKTACSRAACHVLQYFSAIDKIVCKWMSAPRSSPLRVFLWMSIPSPRFDLLNSVTSGKGILLKASQTIEDCPRDVDVVVLRGSAWTTELETLSQIAPGVKALVVSYAGISAQHLRQLKSAFGERLGTDIQLHNLHHNAPITAELALSLLLVSRVRLARCPRSAFSRAVEAALRTGIAEKQFSKARPLSSSSARCKTLRYKASQAV
eukprot:6175827-Pleurochrysis_carterae.AAC.1